MPIETITVFKTSDGRLFEDESVAHQHETELDLKLWYDAGNELYATDNRVVRFCNLVFWIRNHPVEVTQILGERKADENQNSDT